MFRYVDALCLLPLTMYPKTHTHTHTHIYIYIYICVCIYIREKSPIDKSMTLNGLNCADVSLNNIHPSSSILSVSLLSLVIIMISCDVCDSN